MNHAIDAYCYHRQFGHPYPDIETPSAQRMTALEFLDRAHDLGAAGVSLESCFFSDFADRTLAPVRDKLDERGLTRIWAWGHPRGLESGRSETALVDLIEHIGVAKRLGAGVMRICAGGRGTRPESWREHRSRLLPMLRRAAQAAEKSGIVLAVENHLDLYADELRELLEAIGSAHLGACLDTANNLRMFEDPVEVATTLAPFVRATHLKDVTALGGDPRTFAFWPSVALGEGVVNIARILQVLRDAGYDGLLAVELDYLHPRYASVDEALSISLRNLRVMLTQGAP